MDRNRRDSLLRSSIIGGFRAIEREKWIDRKMEREGILGWSAGVNRAGSARKLATTVS